MDETARRFIGRILLVMVTVSALLTIAVGGSVSALPNASADSTVLAAFVELQGYVAGLPQSVLNKGLRTSLDQKIGNAEAAYLRGQPCTAANILGAYLNETSALGRGRGLAIAEDLYYRGLLLQSDLLASLPEGEVCRVQPPEVQCVESAPWPELLPTELKYHPQSVTEDEGTLVEVTVANRGGQSASEVVVAFSSDEEEFARAIIDFISPCGTATTTVWWPGGSMGPHLVEAEVDPDSVIPEGMETNNTAEMQLLVVFELIRPWEPSDLVLSDFAFNPARPVGGESVSLYVTAWNDGDGPLNDIVVSFMVDGEQVAEAALAELVADEEAVVSGLWADATPGRHYLAVVAEQPQGTPDRNTSNNAAAAIVHVGGESDPLPDIVVDEITITEGGSLHVAATISNIGWAEAVGLPVMFMMDDVAFGDATVASLGPSESDTVEGVLSEEPAAGEHIISVVLDPDGIVPKTVAPTNFSKIWFVVGTVLCPSPGTYGRWTSLGPDRLNNGWTGRADTIVIDPNNTSTLYVGAPTGGVWKSTTGGNSWTPVTDTMPSFNISTLMMDPTDSKIVYAGTEAGLYKTTDGGTTWSVFTDTSIGTYFRTLIIRYSGSSFSIYAGTDTGVWRYQGTDKTLKKASPADWKRIKTGKVVTLVQHPTDPTRFWVAIWAKPFSILYRSKGGSIPTGDASWDQLLFFQGPVSLAAAPSKPGMIYAGISEPGKYEVWRSPDWGDSWYKRFYQTTKGEYEWLIDDKGGYWENYYNAYIAVDPSNADIIYRGHVQLYRSDGGGWGWTRIVGVHDDQHGFAFEPGNPQNIYVLGDGGVFKCTGRGASCSSLNQGLRTMQFYDIALARSGPYSSLIIGGTQDNGTIGTTGSTIWQMIKDGDGRYCAIHPTDSSILYAQHQYLNDTSQAIVNWPSPSPKWQVAAGLPGTDHPYFIVNPTDPSYLLAVGPQVYKHPWAQTDWKCSGFFCLPWWTPLGPSGTGVVGSVRRVAVDSDGNIYAGMSSGQIWMFSGSNWEKVFSQVPGMAVSGLVADPSTPKKLWVTFEGTGAAAGPNRIWNLEYSAELKYWFESNITGDLDNSLALGTAWKQSNMLALDPYRSDTVYVATNKGVYKGTFTFVNGVGQWKWKPFNCGLPRTYVADLEVSDSGVLYAATFGRGLYSMPLYFSDE